jgi:hypothetical protein
MADAVSERPGGISAAVAETTWLLIQEHAGLVHEKTHIYSSAGELLNSEYVRSRSFTEEEVAGIREADQGPTGSAQAPSLIAALKADIPGYDWDREIAEFWGSRWKVAVGTLPLTLLASARRVGGK